MRIYHGNDKSEGTNVTYLGGMGENNENNTFIDKKSWKDFFKLIRSNIFLEINCYEFVQQNF